MRTNAATAAARMAPTSASFAKILVRGVDTGGPADSSRVGTIGTSLEVRTSSFRRRRQHGIRATTHNRDSNTLSTLPAANKERRVPHSRVPRAVANPAGRWTDPHDTDRVPILISTTLYVKKTISAIRTNSADTRAKPRLRYVRVRALDTTRHRLKASTPLQEPARVAELFKCDSNGVQRPGNARRRSDLSRPTQRSVDRHPCISTIFQHLRNHSRSATSGRYC